MKLQLYFEPTSKILLQENVKPELSDFQVLSVPYFKIMFILLLLLLFLRYKTRQKNRFKNCIITKSSSTYLQ